ncbi:MAG: S66 family peptidase [Brachybacterium tyrofermentans]
MSPTFPAPLTPGDVVGVTSPSSGVPAELQPRLDVAVQVVRDAGFEVEIGSCMDGSTLVSAPAAERAAEFQRMLVDPSLRAIVPPWGGELAIDVIPLLDWEAIAAAEPTWVVGFSDISTLITPLTLLTGWATVHGQNLLDTPYAIPEGLLGWLDLVQLPVGSTVTQSSPGAYRHGFVDYVEHPEVDEYVLDTPGSWCRLDSLGGDVDVTGRLLGGCIETLSNLAGTRYLDPTPLAAAGDGLIFYVEATGDDAAEICRNLHGMRLSGFFDGASAILVGRTSAPSLETLTQHEAVIDALGSLGVPLLADVECGHVAPYMPLVNGALCRVEHSAGTSHLTQTLA